MKNVIIHAGATWSTAAQSFAAQKGVWQQARAPLAETVAAFHAQTPEGIFGKLGHAFTKAVKIAPMERKIRKLDHLQASEEQTLRKAATQVYRTLGEAALEASQNADDKRTYATLGDIESQLNDTASKLRAAIKEADEASDMELMDMAANNKGISLLSYFETDEAKEAIRAAGESIQALNGKLRDAQKQDVQLAKDLGFGNTLDLFVDMAGGFMGAFTSYLNMQKLDEAVDKMTGILDTVGKMQTEVGTGLRAIQTAAVKAQAGADANLAGLVQQMAPYLPEDTAGVLRGDRPALRVSPFNR